MNIKIIKANIEQLNIITVLFNQYMIFYKKPSNETKYKAYLKGRIERKETTIFLALNSENIPLGFLSVVFLLILVLKTHN